MIRFGKVQRSGYLPIILEPSSTLVDEISFDRDGPSGDAASILNPGNPTISSVATAERSWMRSLPIDLQPTFYDTLVRGCFWGWGFHYTPSGRDAFRVSLEEMAVANDNMEDDEFEEELRQQRIYEHRLYQEMLEADPAARVVHRDE